MSPPLVVAFALAGRVDIDLTPRAARPRHATASRSTCATSGRAPRRSARAARVASTPTTFRRLYADFADAEPAVERDPGRDRRRSTSGTRPRPTSRSRRSSTSFGLQPAPRHATSSGARAARDLRRLGHDRPHQPRRRDQDELARPGMYLQSSTASTPEDFNSYGSRRGNDRVMTRGTFANVRIKNLMVPGDRGRRDAPPARRRACCRSTTPPCATRATASRSSSSPARSTAPAARATGPPRARKLLGVRAVIAQSFERIHRSNLVGMGVLPLPVPGGRQRRDARPRRHRDLRPAGLESRPHAAADGDARDPPRRRHGAREEVPLRVRIDTPIEVDYYRHGGILPYVLRQLMR